MDQHAFSRLHPSERMKRIEGGNESNRNCRSLLHAQVRRLARDEPLMNCQVSGQAARSDRHNLVTDDKVGNRIADGDHAAGALQSEQLGTSAVCDGILGDHPHGMHQILEVEPGGRHLDLDLVGLRLQRARAGVAIATREFPAAAIRSGKAAQRIVLPAHSAQRRRGYRNQAVHIPQLAVQGDLIFRIVRSVQFIDKGCDLLPRAGRQIDEMTAQVLVFGRGDPAESPERRLRNFESAGAVLDRLRRARDEPDGVDREAFRGRKRLEEMKHPTATEPRRRNERLVRHRLVRLDIEAQKMNDTSRMRRLPAHAVHQSMHVLQVAGANGEPRRVQFSKLCTVHHLDDAVSAFAQLEGRVALPRSIGRQRPDPQTPATPSPPRTFAAPMAAIGAVADRV